MNRFSAENPEKHRYTLTMTYTIEDWIRISDKLHDGHVPDSHASMSFRSQITDMVSQAKAIYWPEEQDNDQTK